MTRRRKAPSWPTTPRSRARRPAASRLEFRSPVDGAWYSVRLARQGEALRVMYEEFAEEHDEWYEPRQLAGAHELSDIRARFRLPSMQLEDSRCRTVRPGAALCVSCSFDGGELKFYDAVLESVSSSAHETVDGEERCNCRFLVRWKERPLARSRSEVGIEQVCCVQFSPVQDPILSEFLGRASSLIRKQGIMASHSVSSTTSEHQEGSCSAAASTCPGPGSGGCGRGQRGGGAGEVVEQGRVTDAGDSGGGGAGATDGGVKDAVLPDDGVKLPSGAGAACPGPQQRCRHCKTELTPQWPGTLCNACGVRYMTGRLAPEYRPLSSPALKPERHSNSQRHVLERRRRKELAVAGATAGSQERE